MKLKFLGAAQTVTGSCYLVEGSTCKFLVDCGMYQGVDVEQKNLEPFDFDPAELNFIILTHAHIDHCGLIPKLFKYGFRGSVYLTPETASLARIMLLDSAKIQEKDLEMGREGGSGKMIYGTDDALMAIENFISVNCFDQIKIGEGEYFKFIPAGHVLGAASVYVFCDGKGILFSGDLGRKDQSIIKNFFEYPEIEEKPAYIISESLYGNSIHPERKESANLLVDIIQKTIQRDGNVIIPCFSLHRTQEIIEIMKCATLVADIQENVQIYLDSPMAISINTVYASYTKDFNDSFEYKNTIFEFDRDKLQDATQKIVYLKQDERVQFDRIRYIREYKNSLMLSNKTKSIIIAGSGMADGGRVVHHLYNGLNKGLNSVIFVGYQAEGTLGRQLIDGNKVVAINDKNIIVNAEISYLKGFSAHADKNDLMAWLDLHKSSDLNTIFLVHAEKSVMTDYSDTLKNIGYKVELPDLNQEYIL